MLRSRIAAAAARTCSLALVLAACSAGVDPENIPDPEPPEGIEAPFLVSKYFAPSGFMGDGASGTALVADVTPESCAPRPDGAEGDCYRFTYTAETQLWAGVYWQFPPNNWGNVEGKKIAPGATEVSFWAAGGAGGEKLKVTIGGVKDVTLPFSDTLKAEGTFDLTTTMTRYTVSLGGQSYDRVIGGFSWVVNYPMGTEPATAPPMTIYLDGISWE
jgi:hypothetical protein